MNPYRNPISTSIQGGWPISKVVREFQDGPDLTPGPGCYVELHCHSAFSLREGASLPFELIEIAKKRGVPNAQVALAWVLQQPGITAPIVGASKMQHLDDAIAALGLQLDAAELKALAEPYRPHPVLGHS